MDNPNTLTYLGWFCFLALTVPPIGFVCIKLWSYGYWLGKMEAQRKFKKGNPDNGSKHSPAA